MKTSFFKKGILAMGITCCMQLSAVENPVDYVNTLVGAQSKYELSAGNTYPTTAMPWGMNFWTPQTGETGDDWTCRYDADKIRGFEQIRQPSPWMNNYGQFSITPTTEGLVFDEEKRASRFSHKGGVATPYYYKVYLTDRDVTTELVPTERAAKFRFTLPETKKAYIVIDAFNKGSYIKVLPAERKIIGHFTRNTGDVPRNFKSYFVIQFDKPFTFSSTVKNGAIQSDESEVKTNHAGAITGFETKAGEVVHTNVAFSFISTEQAELNLREVGDTGFDQLVTKGKEIWNRELGEIEVEDMNIDNLRTFYSCLYRSLLFPHSFYETDAKGQVVHYSPYNGEVLPGYMFADTGFWDTFHCLFPLLNLMYPEMDQKMQEGLVNAYKESGFLPEWASPDHRDCMIGNNFASVVADAYIKNLRGYDIETLREALKHDTNSQLPRTASGRVAYEEYSKLGYVSNNIGIRQDVARTLEYAYNDWTIYILGKKFGKSASEIDIFKQRANNYKNVYDPKYKLMVGRSGKDEFNPTLEGTDWGRDFCEGNSWHWGFCVFHDPQDLIDLMGGKKEFSHMMDSVFKIPSRLGMDSHGMIHEMREMQIMNMGQYVYGNQPIQHMVYLYNYFGEPWKVQYWVREIMHKLYTVRADGYRGDEDNGQTSTWYVFSALGFYTVCPGTDQYALGTPLFKSVKLHLDNGKQVLIQADRTDRENRYIKGMKVNGKTYTRNFLTHEQLLGGAKIQYQMSDTSNKQRGIQNSDRPYSFSLE